MSLDERAAGLDAVDPLAGEPAKFSLPDSTIYLDGNSLGPLPRHVPAVLQNVVEQQWGHDLITSWNRHGWWEAPRRAGDRIGRLLGGAPGQVVAGDSTSQQLFSATVAAARLNPGRRTVVIDPASFPTDLYVVASVAELLGLEVAQVEPSHLQHFLADRGSDVAVAVLCEVDFRTGERLDAPALTDALHQSGALVLWDLCHSAGALVVELDAWGADLAVGCGYKFLNGGPGAPAWIYVAQRHQEQFRGAVAGWNGHARPFAFEAAYEPAPGVSRARVGTPAMLSLLSLDAALDVYDGLDMVDVRARSVSLTGFFLECLAELAPDLEPVTPREPERRGSQVSVRHASAYAVVQALLARGVIGDFREPDIARFGFSPLALTHVQVLRAARELADVVATRAYADPALAARTTVT
ncbi:kynureninase [Motilibacter rhizosphaerae]|uniref:Kynureninase n=1 Tax=Motilibacter rhizosphaerae TaxID=598652 RepID=A0A4Q7NZG5_9ACTN|nr:aminotransferase class V-fold PLP-dependent enzyme [Motilibacter rhizosphaerae]RZS91832.1 kynureninase [Motilibacter rhizosphaerae]